MSFADVVKGENYNRLDKSKNEEKVSGDALGEGDSEEGDLFETSDGESSSFESDMELERPSGDTIIKDSFQNPISPEGFYEKVEDDRGIRFETFHDKTDKNGIEETNSKHAENLKAYSPIEELIQKGKSDSVQMVNAVDDAGDTPNSTKKAVNDAGGNPIHSPAREGEKSDNDYVGNMGNAVAGGQGQMFGYGTGAWIRPDRKTCGMGFSDEKNDELAIAEEENSVVQDFSFFEEIGKALLERESDKAYNMGGDNAYNMGQTRGDFI
ncbi:hypothetical protein L2E82_07497 [Cichorium intybus]|uniref:Uncharacterized protein n=1 Tax=Cichorium intybus TaxID=13427 RepID=A0ACB9G5G8_CICIN|nr:hypothetical protein L2E82_07497 [Cichorium intybus]